MTFARPCSLPTLSPRPVPPPPAVRGQATTDCCRSLAVTAGNFVSTAHGNENLHFLAGTYVMFGSNRLNNEPGKEPHPCGRGCVGGGGAG